MPNNPEPKRCPDCGSQMDERGQWGWKCFKCREAPELNVWGIDLGYNTSAELIPPHLMTSEIDEKLQQIWESSKTGKRWKKQNEWINEAFNRADNPTDS